MKLRFILRAVIVFVFAAFAACAADSLVEKVTIYRDNYGVPHIVGETEEATFFGYGYAQAEDHLERMMLQYRDAQGRRAEVEGFNALGDGYLHFIPYEYRWDGDYLQRLLRTKKCVVENRDKIDPQVYKILAAFARGVNQYIAEHRQDIPAWIDSVAAEDIEALERSHYMRFYSIHDALQKMTEKVYDFPDFGSNQWAIAPFKSASGRIMHVEHTHMPWANRFQNYEAHLITPGKLDAAGISWFGSPFFLDGLNDKITWSATWNEPNMADVYEEKINPGNPLQYLYDGLWRDIRVESETFRVKGPKGMESVTLPLYYTHHGPIVSFDKERNRAYAVKLPNYDGVNYSTGMYGLMKSRNLAEFKATLARQLMPRWNLLFSDSENIFWVHNGNVAKRASGYDWSKPVPGWTKDTEWGPYFPFEDYPQLVNPPSGFLQNCNNPPWVVTKNSGLNPLAPAPYYLRVTPKADAGEEALNTRGERLFEVLGQNKKFTLDDMKALAFDTKIMPADVIVPLLERAYASKPSQDAHVNRALDLVKAWDRRSAEDSVAYPYIYYWGREYEELFSGAKFARFVHYGRRKIDINSSEEQDAARRAFEAAVGRIAKQFGKPEVRWGDINVVVRGGKFPMDGTGLYDVLHPDEGVEQENGEMDCNDGWGDLLIVVEGNPKEIWSLLPYGESEHPSSPHYNDLAKLHSRRQAKRFWFTPEDILAHTESVWGDRNRIKALLPRS
ncbi:MAG TPA: penicillin acylase family protein [Bryobacteraceae bacterium]|nr:penicillin acylase family protein [Bryobacteraceae bacterium]